MSSYLSRHDQNSIFGRTYQGVPNPQIPFEHAYPTRYHGAIFTTPRFGMPFEPNPMALAPYAGLGASEGCGCSGKGLGVSPDGLGVSPDGLGATNEPPILGGKVTGNTFFDAVLGAAVGYSVSPSKNQAVKWAVGGAGAVGLFGLPGLIGIVALKMVNKKSGE